MELLKSKNLARAAVLLAVVLGIGWYVSAHPIDQFPQEPEVSSQESKAATPKVLVYVPESEEILVLDQPAPEGTLPIMMTVLPTEVISQKMSPDGRYLFFSISTSINDNFSYAIPDDGILTSDTFKKAYRYDTRDRTVAKLFSEFDIHGYPMIVDISTDGSRIAYKLPSCIYCGGGVSSKVIVVDHERSVLAPWKARKEIDNVAVFKFTGPTSYEYSEGFVVEDCTDVNCITQGPMQTGSF